METEILNSKEIHKAARLVVNNKLVAFPTETVYGLGANAFNVRAVRRIFKAKQRPFSDPLIVHVSSLKMAETVAVFTPEAKKLAKEFWPGPLTLVLKKRPAVSDMVTAGKQTVGVRMPAHVLALKLIQLSGVPIAAPSANVFSHTSPTSWEHVMEDLEGKIEAVIKAGRCRVGVESTVVDMTAKLPKILRPGGLPYIHLKKALPNLLDYSGTKSKKTPGQYKYHYSPKARVVLVKSFKDLRQQLKKNIALPAGVIIFNEWKNAFFGENVILYKWGSKNSLSSLARRLYAGFRKLDGQGVKIIFCPLPSEQGLGKAIVNRLTKASGL